MIRTLEMSSRRGTLGPRLLLDTVHELFEQVARVSWSRARFGVVLHAPGPLLEARDAFDGAVIEVAVGQLDAVRERILAYGEAVILARYLDASRLQVPDGMVRAVVAEGQLVGLATEGEPEELMSEADPEGRDLTEQRAQSVDCRSEGGRVARTVREEEAVWLSSENILRGGGARHSEYRSAPATELPVDRILHPVVDGDDEAAFLSEGGKLRWFSKLRARRGEV